MSRIFLNDADLDRNSVKYLVSRIDRKERQEAIAPGGHEPHIILFEM